MAGLIERKFAQALAEHLKAAGREVEVVDTPAPDEEPLAWPPWVIAKLDGELHPGGTTTAKIWRWNGNDWEATDQTRRVYAVPYMLGTSIAPGKFVKVEYHAQSQRWYVTGAAC